MRNHSIEEIFTYLVRRNVREYKKSRVKSMGKAIFKGVATYGIPLELSVKAVMDGERINRENIINDVSNYVEGL